jgi:mono/diheme cytochrome c family protein
MVLAGAFFWFISTTAPSGQTVTVTAAAATTTAPASTTSLPSDPHVLAGAYTFVQFACSQCHGAQGQGGVSPDVPALQKVATTLTSAQLSKIINHGLGVSSNPSKPYMPVWGEVISSAQVDDLVAYIRAGLPAVPGAAPQPIPSGASPVSTGAVLYQHYGCINCHGPNGLGGVPNPSAPDRTIPPLSGKDFRQQFDTPAKILKVIQSGSVIGRQPIVSMPHWGGIIPKADLDALVAYIGTLKSG